MASADTPESGTDPSAMRRLVLKPECLIAFALGYGAGVNGLDLFTLL